MRFVSQPLAERLHQPRLAHPRLGADERDLAGLLGDALEAIDQHRNLVLASDQRCVDHAGRAEPLIAELRRPEQPMDLDGFGDPLQLAAARLLGEEAPAQQPQCVAADDDRIGLRLVLDPRSQIHRVAEGLPLAARIAADRPDDDGTRMDPHPRRKADPVLRLEHQVETRERLQHAEARMGRATRVVLVRARIAEEHQQPVAEILRDVAVVLLHDARAGRLEALQQRVHVLRIELRRQRRRPDQVAEHHRQVAPLALDGLHRAADRRRTSATEARVARERGPALPSSSAAAPPRTARKSARTPRSRSGRRDTARDSLLRTIPFTPRGGARQPVRHMWRPGAHRDSPRPRRGLRAGSRRAHPFAAQRRPPPTVPGEPRPSVSAASSRGPVRAASAARLPSRLRRSPGSGSCAARGPSNGRRSSID